MTTIRKTPEYIIMNPTGNITALVTEQVADDQRKDIAAAILSQEPQVEQLGFLSSSEEADLSLYMAGGEFCGNASMCAAVYYAREKNLKDYTIKVEVSGAERPVEVLVGLNQDDAWSCTVHMPKPTSIESYTFADGRSFPVVHMPGIDHIICRTDVPETEIDRSSFETRIKSYCAELASPGIGMMMLNESSQFLMPLVYIPGADTLFWEHSCASGTTAVGAWLNANSSRPVNYKLHEPGGDLTINVTEDDGYYLSGTVTL